MNRCSITGDNFAKCSFYDMGRDGEPYPTLLRVLTKARGVYAIRDKATKKVLYVGSSASTLYSTVTRHMQRWRRAKGYWSGHYGKAHDPGLTYQRHAVEVAIEVMRKNADHLAREAELIAALRPRDNLVLSPDGEGETRKREERDEDLEDAPY